MLKLTTTVFPHDAMQLQSGALAGDTVTSNCTHILVPTCLASHEIPALHFAAELSALYRATLTILHVNPEVDPPSPTHWLCGIERLHAQPEQQSLETKDQQRERILELLSQSHPHAIRDGLEARIECRCGDLAKTTGEFMRASAVDLVVLSGGPRRWWYPILPVSVRRILKRAEQRVLVIF